MTFTLFLPIIIITAVTLTPVQGIAGIANCGHIIGDVWHQWTPGGLNCPGAEFWPMVRDANQWQQLASGTLQMPMGSRVVQGPNEPDLCPYQACLTPEETVPLWVWMQETYSDTHDLIAPVPSPNDIDWIRRFRTAFYNETGEYPHFDSLAAHIYIMHSGYSYGGIGWAKRQLEQYIRWAHLWGIEKVAVTEWGVFAIDPTRGEDYDYDTAIVLADEMLGWMSAQPEVEATFWYSARDWPGVWPNGYTTALFDEADELTPLGEWYATR